MKKSKEENNQEKIKNDKDVNECIMLSKGEHTILLNSNKKLNESFIQIGQLFVNLLDRYIALDEIRAIHEKNIQTMSQRYFKEIKGRNWHVDLADGKIIVRKTN